MTAWLKVIRIYSGDSNPAIRPKPRGVNPGFRLIRPNPENQAKPRQTNENLRKTMENPRKTKENQRKSNEHLWKTKENPGKINGKPGKTMANPGETTENPKRHETTIEKA